MCVPLCLFRIANFVNRSVLTSIKSSCCFQKFKSRCECCALWSAGQPCLLRRNSCGGLTSSQTLWFSLRRSLTSRKCNGQFHSRSPASARVLSNTLWRLIYCRLPRQLPQGSIPAPRQCNALLAASSPLFFQPRHSARGSLQRRPPSRGLVMGRCFCCCKPCFARSTRKSVAVLVLSYQGAIQLA